MASMRWVTRKPPNMFTLASMTAKNPNAFEAAPNADWVMSAPTAISAPTITTD